MDRQFVRNTLEAILVEYQIPPESPQSLDDLVDNMVMKDLRELRSEDPDIYNQLYEMNKFGQQQVLRIYIENAHYLYMEDSATAFAQLIESDPVLYDEMYESVRDWLDSLAQTAYDIGKRTGDATYRAGKVSIKGTGAGVAYIAGLTYKLMSPSHAPTMSRALFRTLKSFSSVWDSFVKKLRTSGAFRMRYAIIQRNIEQCYSKCGFDPSMAKLGHYAGTTDDAPWWGKLTTRERIKTAECLRKCYTQYLMDTITLYMEEYFACLQKSGQNIKGAEDDIMKFINRMSGVTDCRQYHDSAKDVFKYFDKIVKFAYSETGGQMKRREIYDQLRKQLYDTRVKVERQYNV